MNTLSVPLYPTKILRQSVNLLMTSGSALSLTFGNPDQRFRAKSSESKKPIDQLLFYDRNKKF